MAKAESSPQPRQEQKPFNPHAVAITVFERVTARRPDLGITPEDAFTTVTHLAKNATITTFIPPIAEGLLLRTPRGK